MVKKRYRLTSLVGIHPNPYCYHYCNNLKKAYPEIRNLMKGNYPLIHTITIEEWIRTKDNKVVKILVDTIKR